MVKPAGPTAHLVAVAGTHGKTTTTVMTTIALEAAGAMPTGLAGGRVSTWGGNLRMNGRDLLVVEADEYDKSFLALNPTVVVVTNVEADHLDTYRDLADVHDAFSAFAERAQVAVLCADDPGARSLKTPRARRLMYGLGEGADLRARNVSFDATGSSFDVSGPAGSLGKVALRVPGRHNVRNSLAAIGVGMELGLPFARLAAGLSTFTGVQRRFELVGTEQGITVVDDYAHHPTEIAATLDAAFLAFPGRRVVCAFQPHLYTRTRDFAANFGKALAKADVVLLTEIYAARESPIEGVDSGLIEREIESAGGNLVWRGSRAGLEQAIRETVRPGDVVLTLGAGDITAAGRSVIHSLRAVRS
jgi:UDP-N-acetylmuramate--alanine ligase